MHFHINDSWISCQSLRRLRIFKITRRAVTIHYNLSILNSVPTTSTVAAEQLSQVETAYRGIWASVEGPLSLWTVSYQLDVQLAAAEGHQLHSMDISWGLAEDKGHMKKAYTKNSYIKIVFRSQLWYFVSSESISIF